MHSNSTFSPIINRTAPSMLRNLFLAASIAVTALAATAPSAHAQFSSLSLPTLTEASGSASGGTKVGKNGYFSFGFYPYAPFQFNASVKSFPISVTATTQNDAESKSAHRATVTEQADISGTSASFTASGVLFAPEYVYSMKDGHSGIGVGGWYWLHTQDKSEDYSGKFDSDLYDIHAKYYFTPKVGLEVGYLGQTNSSIPKQEGVNAYVSYAFGPNDAMKKGSFGLTTALGLQNVEKTSLSVTSENVNETFDFKIPPTSPRMSPAPITSFRMARSIYRTGC